MRKALAFVVLASASLLAQQSPGQFPNGQPELKRRTDLPRTEVRPEEPQKPLWIVPAGTRIPVQLRQAISTKNARSGDAIYGQTTFPVVINEQVMIPGGTYVQGVVDRVKRAGRIKGTAEMEFHLTTLLYPNGYTLNVAAAVDQVPGDENSRMKEPGTIKHDSEKGKDLERIGRNSTQAGAIGSMAGAAASGSARGFGVGGLSGVAAGAMIGILARGSDLRFEAGTVVDVVLNHAIALDPAKLMRSATVPAYYPQQQILQFPAQQAQ
jgi:type IV secretion system protein VirB10